MFFFLFFFFWGGGGGGGVIFSKLLLLPLLSVFFFYHVLAFTQADRPDLLIRWLVDWLIWAIWPFETVFQSISGRLPERGREEREMVD